jgi:hypothetical protein
MLDGIVYVWKRKRIIETIKYTVDTSNPQILATSHEVPIFSKFIGFFDILNESCALSKDKCFREKDSFLPDWISF